MLTFDHLAVSCVTLDEGVDWVESRLGVSLGGGGKHPHMATHNRLLGLGDLYLEVIASDPSVPSQPWPRWFDLDNFAGPPRLTNWVARCEDLTEAIDASPKGAGVPVFLSRGNFHWEMAVPSDGKLPFDGAFPALIHWQGTAHPTQMLADVGIFLEMFEIEHPDIEALTEALGGMLTDSRVVLLPGPTKAMRATFGTPHGRRVLE
jgi:hypothetical protein